MSRGRKISSSSIDFQEIYVRIPIIAKAVMLKTMKIFLIVR